MSSISYPTLIVGRGSVARRLAEQLEGTPLRVVAECASAELLSLLERTEAQVVLVIATGSMAELEVAEQALNALPPAQRPVTVAVLSDRTVAYLRPSRMVDDFAVWHCTAEEIIARVSIARWRRTGIDGEGTLRSGELAVDIQRHRVVVAGREVHLTVREYELLLALLRARGTALSRQKLLDEVWGPDYFGGPRTVDIHIRRLRAKMPEIADRIVTVRGVGYRLASPDEQ